MMIFNDTIIKYPMKSNKEKPLFNYLIKSSMEMDYWLFDDFEEAINCAKVLNRKLDDIILIYEPHFNMRTKEYCAKLSYWVTDEGELIYEERGSIELHVEFYINAGTWENPNKEWIKKVLQIWEQKT